MKKKGKYEEKRDRERGGGGRMKEERHREIETTRKEGSRDREDLDSRLIAV